MIKPKKAKKETVKPEVYLPYQRTLTAEGWKRRMAKTRMAKKS